MTRGGYYHGDKYIGPSSKHKYAKKTVYNSGTYNKSRSNHKSTNKSKKSCPQTSNISKRDNNSFLTSDGKYSKRLESNKCIFCGKTYNRNIHMLCPHCFIKCSRCGKKYSTIRNKSCPHCGNINPKTSNKSNSKPNYSKTYYKSQCSKCGKVYDKNIHSSCPHCKKSKSYKKSSAKYPNKSKSTTTKSDLKKTCPDCGKTYDTNRYESCPFCYRSNKLKCPICGKKYNKFKYKTCPYCDKDTNEENIASNSSPIIGFCLVGIILVIIFLILIFY